MSVGLILYILVGFIWVKLENDTFDLHFDECTRSEAVIGICQQIVHYARVWICWPLYLVEDLLIYLDNRGAEEEG